MGHQYQVTLFRAEQQQKLRNVRIHSPSLIQIVKGSKHLFWKDEVLDIHHPNIMLCEANASLNFENLPLQGRFLSRMFSFHCVPSDEMLELSMSNALGNYVPVVETDKALQATLNALFSFERESLSEATQRYWIMGLYQQLAERGLLHRLFSSSHISFS
ncbi:AraC family transcriptional regulator, partial [Vibrio parahaemolyticus]|nr:AraC family transcriptional regulator [Vibrio parahaemolyticus]